MRTVHLGQFTDDNAGKVVEALDEAGITHWVKRAGGFSRFFFAGEWGVRVFVDADRRDEAVAIADRTLGHDRWR
jgi:hypothetical protein